jgi:hypothetical protein
LGLLAGHYTSLVLTSGNELHPNHSAVFSKAPARVSACWAAAMGVVLKATARLTR